MYVTHHVGRRGGLTEALILEVVEAASKAPAGILARDEQNAADLARRVREKAPEYEVVVKGTCVRVATRSDRR